MGCLCCLFSFVELILYLLQWTKTETIAELEARYVQPTTQSEVMCGPFKGFYFNIVQPIYISMILLDVFDAFGLSAALSHQYRVTTCFHVSTDISVQNWFLVL